VWSVSVMVMEMYDSMVADHWLPATFCHQNGDDLDFPPYFVSKKILMSFPLLHIPPHHP
jgi:hypothetical protein